VKKFYANLQAFHSTLSFTILGLVESMKLFFLKQTSNLNLMKQRSTSLLQASFLGNLFIVLGLLAAHTVVMGQTATVTISDEAFGNNATGRTAAAALDDSWAASLSGGVIPEMTSDIFSGATSDDMSGTSMFSFSGSSYQVDWQIVCASSAMGPGDPLSAPALTDFTDVASGTSTIVTATTIQAGAPNPFPSVARLSTNLNSGSCGGLNGIELDFTSSVTDITEFGIFIGDLESRPNNGTVAHILVYDVAGNLMINGEQEIVYNGNVQNGTNYTVTEPLGLPSGPENNNNSTGYWGNETTAFVTVSADQPIGHVIFIVGDDDHTTSNDGATEQLGLVGFQLPVPPITATAQASCSNDDTPPCSGTALYLLDRDH
jgi:hypothetical protein